MDEYVYFCSDRDGKDTQEVTEAEVLRTFSSHFHDPRETLRILQENGVVLTMYHGFRAVRK